MKIHSRWGGGGGFILLFTFYDTLAKTMKSLALNFNRNKELESNEVIIWWSILFPNYYSLYNMLQWVVTTYLRNCLNILFCDEKRISKTIFYIFYSRKLLCTILYRFHFGCFFKVLRFSHMYIRFQNWT